MLICLMLLLVSVPIPIKADEIQDNVYRLDVNPQWYSFDDYVIKGSIGVSKKNDSLFDRKQFYARPSIAYGFNEDWTARFGIYGAYNRFETVDDTVELRPYVGLGYFHTLEEIIEPIDFSAYFRIEDRIIYNTESWKNVQNLRARLRVWGIYNLHPTSIEHSWHRVIIGAELLRTYFNEDQRSSAIDEHFEVETRLSLAIERTLKKNQKVRFDVSWHYQVPFNEINDYKFNTIVFTIKYFPSWGDILGSKLFRNVDE